MSAPVGKPSKPRWVNPCSLPGHVFDASRDMTDAPPIPMDELYNSVIVRSRISRDHATQVKNSFLEDIFGEPEFEDGVADYKQEWLPDIPDPEDEENFRAMTNETAFPTAYEYLQYFGVGLEQILLDQVLYDGMFATQFRDIENHLTQVLCELQLAMHILRIVPNADVMRDVMSQKYRDLNGSSARNMRDYLIIRDYIKATHYVLELFNYLNRNRTSS